MAVPASTAALPPGASRPVASGRWLVLCLWLSGCTVSGPFYHPDRADYGSPASIGLDYRSATFSSRDGTRLAGWFIPAVGYPDPRQAKGTVIHFHGNAQNISAHWRFVGWLPQRGFNVFVFDYRGYGQSEGRPEPKGVFEDSNAALDHVRARPDVDPERLLVFGQSLGGTHAIAAVGDGNRAGVKAVAIEATFSSYSAIANDKFAGAGLLVDDTYSADRYIGRLAPIPLLLLHGTADPLVPHAHSLALLEKAGPPRRMISVAGGGHLAAFASEGPYREALLEFFSASLPALSRGP